MEVDARTDPSAQLSLSLAGGAAAPSTEWRAPAPVIRRPLDSKGLDARVTENASAPSTDPGLGYVFPGPDPAMRKSGRMLDRDGRFSISGFLKGCVLGGAAAGLILLILLLLT
jgi:hypothetical protein